MCCVIAPSQAEADGEVEVVYVRQPTVEQALLARELMLPLTFFCYQNEPGYTSDDQTDGEKHSLLNVFYLHEQPFSNCS